MRRGHCTLSLEYTNFLSAYIGGVQMRESIPGGLSQSLGTLNKNKSKKTVTCDVTCTRFPLQCTDVTDYNFSCTLTESD